MQSPWSKSSIGYRDDEGTGASLLEGNGEWLDLIILEAFTNLNDFVIL